jgi:hypothetical protein
MTQEEKEALRAAIQKALGNEPARTPVAMPHGIDPNTMTPEAAQEISDLYISHTLAKPAGAVTPAEREGLRSAIRRAVEDL